MLGNRRLVLGNRYGVVDALASLYFHQMGRNRFLEFIMIHKK
jgi:hypothetical protein